MPNRVYFYADGQELTSHPYNGAIMNGASAAICKDGRQINSRVSIDIHYRGHSVPVTIADFDHDEVVVKDWWHDGERAHVEWFFLRGLRPGEAECDKVRGWTPLDLVVWRTRPF